MRNCVGTTAYATGPRIGEVARLKVAAVDSRRMVIHVEHGKGGRDRYAMLLPQLLGVLRAYWRRARPALWLFPGREPGTPVSIGAAGRLPSGAAQTRINVEIVVKPHRDSQHAPQLRVA